MLPRFLSLAEVLEFHEDLVKSFGGISGVRDLGLLESAVAMPQSGSEGTFFHPFPFEMAAALVFLELNGFALLGGESELEAATWKLASGTMDKTGFAKALNKAYNLHRKKT